MKVVDMSAHVLENRQTLIGYDHGVYVREQVELDKLDQSDEKVLFTFFNIRVVTTSFLLGMFGNSMKQLSKEEFEYKYHFYCSELVRASVEDAIKRMERGSYR